MSHNVLFCVFTTVRYLKRQQILYQIINRLYKCPYKECDLINKVSIPIVTSFIDKYEALSGGSFSFINIRSEFTKWNDASNGMLWAYNLNYMDFLLQKNQSFTNSSYWIDKFIAEIEDNTIGLDPYPTALRGINWIKFITLNYKHIDSERLYRWNIALYSQYKLLLKRIEYHLLGNHLLEDAYSIFIASIYFDDYRLFAKASDLLMRELGEQVLADGAHFEQSPMYHCILLERLLDCYNFSYNNLRFKGQDAVTADLRGYCERMLGHLESIVYSDQTIPLLNDSANGISPAPGALFDYAKRLGLSWRKIEMKECGYRHFSDERMEAFVDVGAITASYQPGHSHADTFNYELHIDGKPVVVDTGISTYNKTERRQYERSTVAHNTVSVNNRNSSEVWGGFRVGRRADVKILKDAKNDVEAVHNGYSTVCKRKFTLTDSVFTIEDQIGTEAVSHIHLWPDEQVEHISNDEILTTTAIIKIFGATSVEVDECQISTEYNRFMMTKKINIGFSGKMHYKISIR